MKSCGNDLLRRSSGEGDRLIFLKALAVKLKNDAGKLTCRLFPLPCPNKTTGEIVAVSDEERQASKERSLAYFQPDTFENEPLPLCCNNVS
jgi:hypothetical protein